MDHIKQFVIELEGTFPWNKREGWKLDYHNDATWVRIYFNSDRFILRDNIAKIESLLSVYNLKGELDTSWTWSDTYYDNLSFRNCNRTYALFITPSNTLYEPVTVDVSDTKDELYDVDLFAYRDAMNKNNRKCPPFYSYTRTEYGYIINFYVKKEATVFYNQNPFNRLMGITQDVDRCGKNVYYIHLYMNDKIPDNVQVLTKPTSKRKARTIFHSIDKQSRDLVKSALAKLTTDEVEALGLLNYLDM